MVGMKSLASMSSRHYLPSILGHESRILPPNIDKEQWDALIGIVTAIVGNVLISFALNLQRYAHIRINREQKSWQGAERSDAENGKTAKVDEETSLLDNGRRPNRDSDNNLRPIQLDMDEEDEDVEENNTKKSYLKSPWWWAGIILMTIGEAGNFLAYGFAPASLVSPLGVVALISNCIIAPWLLKEQFRKRDGLGVLIAIGGVVTLVLSSKGQEKRMGPDDIWHEITRWEFELYLGLTAGAILVLIWASEKYGERTLLIDLGLVGLFGGYTVLSTKGIASLLSASLWKAVTFPITYLLGLVLVGTALMQIRYLNRALSRFDSTQVIPTQFVMFTISVIVGSAVLYRDFESADGERVGKFVGGCTMTFLGVYLITSGRHSDDGTANRESNNQDTNQGISLVDEESGYVEGSTENTISHQRTNSLRPASRSDMLQRQVSNISQQSQPRTPPNTGQDVEFLENPWTDASRNSPHRYHSYNTTSTTLTDGEGQPRTPGTSATQRNYFPNATPPSSRHRRSIVDLFPGPISTTLSSSLSGVIADRRRELEASASYHRPIGLHKSKSSRLRTAEAGGEGNGLQRNPPSAPVPTINNLQAENFAEAVDPAQRSHSISLGEDSSSGLLGSPSKKSKSEGES